MATDAQLAGYSTTDIGGVSHIAEERKRLNVRAVEQVLGQDQIICNKSELVILVGNNNNSNNSGL